MPKPQQINGQSLWRPESHLLYPDLYAQIEAYREESESKWQQWMRAYGENDLYFLLRYILSTSNPKWLSPETGEHRLHHPFPFKFCRSLETEEHNVLRIFAREHLKSTVSTFARSLQIIIQSRASETIAIFSDTLKLARSFCKQIKVESEKNELLYILWPEIFWSDGKTATKESPSWNVGESNPGLTFKRKVNVKEANVTPVGLDSAPETGPHYDWRRYDDIVTRRNTRSTKLMRTTRENLNASHSLGKEGGNATYVGTFYHPQDAYHDMEREGKVRIIKVPCWRNDGAGKKVSVFYSVEYLAEKKVQCGAEEFAIQWECNPQSGKADQIEVDWLRYYRRGETPEGSDFNLVQRYARRGLIYMLVDGAGGEKDNTTDFTVIQVWATQADETLVLLDMLWDRLDPDERTDAALEMYRRWGMRYRFQECRWESYAMDSDIFWLKKKRDAQGLSFRVVKVAGVQKNRKHKAIAGRVIPLFKAQRVLLPEELFRECKHLGGGELDLTQVFVSQEILAWPLVEHDDMLDCMSRLVEPDRLLNFPEAPMAPITDRWSSSGGVRHNAPDPMAPWSA